MPENTPRREDGSGKPVATTRKRCADDDLQAQVLRLGGWQPVYLQGPARWAGGGELARNY